MTGGHINSSLQVKQQSVMDAYCIEKTRQQKECTPGEREIETKGYRTRRLSSELEQNTVLKRGEMQIYNFFVMESKYVSISHEIDALFFLSLGIHRFVSPHS